jgi:hypothetical protein
MKIGADVSFTATGDNSLGSSALVFLDGFLYTVGGISDGGVESTVRRATVGDNCLLGPFELLASLNQARRAAGAVVIERTLVIGGENQADGLSTIESAEILADGTLGPWEFTGATPGARTGQGVALVQRDDGLWMFGGRSGDLSVHHSPAPINLEVWASVGSLRDSSCAGDAGLQFCGHSNDSFVDLLSLGDSPPDTPTATPADAVTKMIPVVAGDLALLLGGTAVNSSVARVATTTSLLTFVEGE